MDGWSKYTPYLDRCPKGRYEVRKGKVLGKDFGGNKLPPKDRFCTFLSKVHGVRFFLIVSFSIFFLLITYPSPFLAAALKGTESFGTSGTFICSFLRCSLFVSLTSQSTLSGLKSVLSGLKLALSGRKLAFQASDPLCSVGLLTLLGSYRPPSPISPIWPKMLFHASN